MVTEYDFYDSFLEEFEKDILNDNRKIKDIENEKNKKTKKPKNSKNKDKLENNDKDNKGGIYVIEGVDIDENNNINVKVTYGTSEINFTEYCFCYNEKLSNSMSFRKKPVFNIVNEVFDNPSINSILLEDRLSSEGFHLINGNYIVFEKGEREQGESILKSLGMRENEEFIKNYFKVKKEPI